MCNGLNIKLTPILMFPQNLTLIPITEKLLEIDQAVIGWNGKQLVAAKYVKRLQAIDGDMSKIEDVGMFETEKYVSQGDRSLVNYWVGITHWMPAIY